MGKGKSIRGHVEELARQRREAERIRLRARIITVKGLVAEYSGKTIENVLQTLEAVYDYKFGKD